MQRDGLQIAVEPRRQQGRALIQKEAELLAQAPERNGHVVLAGLGGDHPNPLESADSAAPSAAW